MIEDLIIENEGRRLFLSNSDEGLKVYLEDDCNGVSILISKESMYNVVMDWLHQVGYHP